MSAVGKIVFGVGMIAVGAALIETPFGVPLILGGITTTAGGILQALTPTPRIGGGGARGSDVNVQQSIPPELIVYGKALIPGTPIFVKRYSVSRSKADDEFSCWIYVHTRRRPMEGILALTIAGERFDLVANGTTNSDFPADALIPDGGKYSNNIAVWQKRGALDDPPFYFLQQKIPHNWKDSDKLTSIAATFVIYKFDAKLWPSGPPEIKFYWKGFLCSDIRNPTAPPAWTENGPLCYADALIGPHAGEEAVDPLLIDPTTLIAAANTADEQITDKFGNTFARYRCGGFADAGQPYDQTLSDILATFDGSAVRVGASHEIYAGAPRTVEGAMDASGLAGPIKVQPLRDRDTLTNEVHSLYPDERVAWTDAESPTWPPFTFDGNGGGGPAWSLDGMFAAPPDVNDFWFGHKNTGNNSSYSNLNNGVSLKGGGQGNPDANSLAFCSKQHLDGDFSLSFSTTRRSANFPNTGQGEIGFRLYIAATGSDDATHPTYMSMWDPGTRPSFNDYTDNVNAAVIRMYRKTTTDRNDTDPLAVNIIDASGSAASCTVTGPATEIDYSQDLTIHWQLDRVGDNLHVAITSDSQTLEWDVDITGAPSRGGFVLHTTAAMTVDVTNFKVTDGTLVSPGPELCYPGAWPSTTVTFAFPAAGFSGWRATSDAFITTPLADTFTPAPTGMKDGFRAALAQMALDTGFTFNEVAASSAQILIAVSPGLAAKGYNGYTFRAPSGAIFIDDGHAGDDYSSGTYMFQVCMHELCHALGLVHPPLGSVVDDYKMTIMVRDTVNAAPWATALRQMDKDALKVQYDQVLGVTSPSPGALSMPSGVTGVDNPYRDDDGGQRLVRELRFPFVPWTNQVQRLQMIWLRRHRYQLTWTGSFRPDYATLTKPMMVITYSDPLTGWSDVLFQIARYKNNFGGSIDLSFARYGADIWAWSAQDEQTENGTADDSGGLELFDDNATTPKNTPVTISPLDNDIVLPTATISDTSTPTNGTVSISDDGLDITYTPNLDWIGFDSFTYTATDGVDSGQATITVNTVDDTIATAVDDNLTVVGDAQATLDVLANDLPATGKTIVSKTSPSNGTLVISSDNLTLKYTRNTGFVGFDSFTYTMTALSTTSTANVTLTVKDGIISGDNQSGLAWPSGMCSTGDIPTASTDGPNWATWRGRLNDIYNFRCPRKGTFTDISDYLTAHASTYHNAYADGVRVEQVMPLFPSGATAGSYATRHKAAAAGAYDSYHTDFANIIHGHDRTSNGPIVIRLAHECGSASQDDAYVHDTSANKIDFRTGWRRVAHIYQNKFGSAVLMDWNNIQHPPDPRPAYPGDDCVDIIGCDAYCNESSGFPVTDAEWSAYANKTNGGAPAGPRAWYLYAKGLGKMVGYAEWGLSHPPGVPKGDCVRYIQGMWDLFAEAAADNNRCAYECYFNANDAAASKDHRLFVSGNTNPLSTTKYHNLWTP